MKKQNNDIYIISTSGKKDKSRGFSRKFNETINNVKSLGNFIFWLFVLSVLWCVFVLVANKFSIAFGWDYCSQYLTFYYGYWDIWRNFFKTGEFALVDFSTYLGVDNIGSNSYYGLFDPFVIALTLFPRNLIPQTFTVMTMLKCVCSALMMRAYLKYMGIKEGTSRLGAIAYAFNGFMNFMVGFPSFVSVVVYVPLLLLGIEKVVKEQKPTILVWSLFLIGITSFFFLVVLCIFGVLYAIWRFLQTVKTRHAKENAKVMIMGFCCFLIGLFLCSFTLLPSLRQSTLSGRTESIGSLYLKALINSLSEGGFVELMFEQVGGSPARTIMPLVSFFYPTGGYLYLPVMIPSASYKYDAWVSSIFCYTPFIILFFQAMLNSARKKKYTHFIAIIICLYLLFTDFAYFAFFAFTGNGYGRWFLILIPCIIYYGCWAFDDVKESPKSFPVISGVLAILATLSTYFVMRIVLEGKTFENPNGYSYFRGEGYLLPGEYTSSYQNYGYNTIFTLLYEVLFVLIEGSSFAVFNRKPWFRKFFVAMLTVEVVIMGNMNYVFCGYWSITKSFNGGEGNFSDSINIGEYISNQDDLVYRTYIESANREKNFANAVKLNSGSTFHSLLNFEVYDYTLMMNMTNSGSGGVSYGGKWHNPAWSGQYTSKRFATDVKLGYKYYVIKDGGYPGWESENVPFNSELFYSYKSPYNNQGYRVYKNNDAVSLGYAVDSSQLYYMSKTGEDYFSFFYDGTLSKVRGTENLLLEGAIFEDGEEVEGFNIKQPTALTQPGKVIDANTGYSGYLYTTNNNDLYLASTESSYRNEGPIYFVNHYEPTELKWSGEQVTYRRDYGKILLYPKTGFGTYFNTDPNGAYFNMQMFVLKGQEPRVYMFGDTFDENGNLLATDQLLNYEYRSMYNDERSMTYLNGLYAKGKVKYICFCAPSGGLTSTLRKPTFHMQEYSEINAKLQRIHENELKNVKKESTNSLSATSSYSEDKIVVTHIAYDESWHIYANGNEINTYKLDGGFLGFVAPKGDVTYTFKYATKYLSLGVALFILGTSCYTSYMIYDFVHRKKKLKLEMSLTNN